MMNVLLIGSGGREHALALKIVQSKQLNNFYAAPGNPGIAEVAECISIDIKNNAEVVEFAKQKKIDMVVIGPEDPLANGLTDALEKEGIKVFGPNAKAAQFEASKSFARRFMKKYNLPTVEFREFTEIEKAEAYIKEKGTPIVIKADGLAAGKGVCVAKTKDEAITFSKECLDDNKFGDASSKIIIEECLIGEEASYLVFMDSKTFRPMVYSQDHKPIFENDKGPNTGGMGTYSPAPILDGLEDELEDIINKFIKGINQENIIFKGVLYVGLMKTAQGLKILEFNCRFGDPETQVILPRMKTDILEVFDAVADQKLDELNIEWSDEHCICVVLASGGYPDIYEKGKKITGLDKVNDVQIIHAGTKKLDDGSIVTNGGRVLNVVALGNDLKEAADKAYSEIKKISFEGAYYRKDIGKKELDRQK